MRRKYGWFWDLIQEINWTLMRVIPIVLLAKCVHGDYEDKEKIAALVISILLLNARGTWEKLQNY